jgi:lipid-binding SYLF domain-containing protein
MNTIKSIRSIVLASFAAYLLVFAGFAAAADPKPSATLTLKETEVGVLIGGDWGHGTLTYKGEPHMFHMSGAKIGGIGITVAEVTGEVYNLNKLEDFAGGYFKAEAGITAAAGREGSWVKNDKGVVLHMTSHSKGLALSIGVEGLKISM